MNRHPPGVHELAARLLLHEAGGAAAPAAAVERVWRGLEGELEPLVGRGGADALVTRAVGLARREFPFLGTVRPSPGAPVDFAGLRQSLQGRDGEEVQAAGVAVLAHLLGLLVALLGEDLGLHPVRKLWPGV